MFTDSSPASRTSAHKSFEIGSFRDYQWLILPENTSRSMGISSYLCPSLTFKQLDLCSKCPRLSLTNLAYNASATNTAKALINAGYRNWSSLENAMVRAKEQSSKKFWSEASSAENEPRLCCSIF